MSSRVHLMARRAGLLIVALAMLAAPAQAHSGRGATRVVFSGALPCAIVCSYWVDNGFAACENPFPPGSYVDHVTVPAPAPQPTKVMVLEATLDQQVDWDHFLCSAPAPSRELASGADILGEPCDYHYPPYSLCVADVHEDSSTPVVEGQRVIFRAYNWVDALDARGQYWFIEV